MQIVTLASKMSCTSSYFDYIYQLTAASELVRGQAVDSFVLEMIRFVQRSQQNQRLQRKSFVLLTQRQISVFDH